MLKTEFQAALRVKLRAIPLATRKTWNDTALYIWWLEAKKDDPYLTWDRCPGDSWQWVPGMCRDLIGESAY
ncbi:hypothetical protein MasN3_39730 [Massilia varians]|uniref:Uncharacterized protein n=1 Tax=Massilia varians TaxID=457921 RepID=A0ABN6THF5_9BURK|nr:hypothetical protein MasN3_39730 [Massilia varians]